MEINITVTKLIVTAKLNSNDELEEVSSYPEDSYVEKVTDFSGNMAKSPKQLAIDRVVGKLMGLNKSEERKAKLRGINNRDQLISMNKWIVSKVS